MRLLLTHGRGTARLTRGEAFLFFQVPRMSHRQSERVGTGASEPSTDVVWPDATRARQRDKGLRTYKDEGLC